MIFIAQHRWGKTERCSDISAIAALLSELDSHPEDDEHVSVAVRLPSGPCISVFVSGLIVYENVEDIGVAPRHIRVADLREAQRLLELLATNKLSGLESLIWKPGNS